MKGVIKRIIVRLLEWEARFILWRFQPRIVAVTGSVGKTSTKDAIAHVMAYSHTVQKSEKSYNSEFGVPLTILGEESGWSHPLRWLRILGRGGVKALCRLSYPQWLVLEVGADRPGDIQRITKWLSPSIAVFTQFSTIPAHIEFFSSRQELLDEKAALMKAVPKDGTVILNRDDTEVAEMARRTSAASFYFGLGETAHIYSSHIDTRYTDHDGVRAPHGITFKVNANGSSVPVTITGALGRQHVYPALAASAVAFVAGEHMLAISEAFRSYQPPAGRMRVFDGLKGSFVIDDSYNSSPIALTEALETLHGLDVSGRRIAVLGDMRELGQYAHEQHREAGRHAAHVCDMLYAVGDYAADAAHGAQDAGMSSEMIMTYASTDGVADHLGVQLAPGDVVLVKGSQAVRCERVVEGIMNRPQDAPELLVRQGRDWQNR